MIKPPRGYRAEHTQLTTLSSASSLAAKIATKASSRGLERSFSLRDRNAKGPGLGMLSVDAKVSDSSMNSPKSQNSASSLSRSQTPPRRKKSVVQVNNIKSKKVREG